MGLSARMAAAATECARNPNRVSVWSDRLGRYVCSNHSEYERAAAEQHDAVARGHPPLGAAFKLVFLSALGGTALFTAICVATTVLAGRDPPSLTVEVVRWLADLAKIGFGATTGMLGGHSLRL